MQPEPAPSEPEAPKPEPELEPAPEPEGPEIPVEVPVQEDTRALTLADLACTLFSILSFVLIWMRKKDPNNENEIAEREGNRERSFVVRKVISAALAIGSIILFILTQPFVWCFRLMDEWTLFFALSSATTFIMLIYSQNKNSENEEETI